MSMYKWSFLEKLFSGFYFPYLLKASKNQKFSDVFRGYKKRKAVQKSPIIDVQFHKNILNKSNFLELFQVPQSSHRLKSLKANLELQSN